MHKSSARDLQVEGFSRLQIRDVGMQPGFKSDLNSGWKWFGKGVEDGGVMVTFATLAWLAIAAFDGCYVRVADC
jgi:hypothetical protein